MPSACVQARAEPPSEYLARVEVKDQFCEWDKPFPGYKPKEFTTDAILSADYSDPMDFKAIGADEWRQRGLSSVEGVLRFGIDGCPLNPRGRTGLRGRGSLSQWGPNFATDPIVTRYDPVTPQMLQVLCKWRAQDNCWALPGAMLKKIEGVMQTKEEGLRGALMNDVISPFNNDQGGIQLVERLMHSGKDIYQGYVDDPRNTDNAWAETWVVHYHCNKKLGERLQNLPHDQRPSNKHADVNKLHWINVDISHKLYQTLFANHKDLVDQVPAVGWLSPNALGWPHLTALRRPSECELVAV